MSQEHLENGALTIIMESGGQARFRIEDLPAGQSAMIFELDSQPLGESDRCAAVYAQLRLLPQTPLLADKIGIQTEGTMVTLTNLTGSDLTDLTVYCHCLLDTEYFGGLTYTYSIDSLGAGESLRFDAADCYMGEAAVVKITQADQ